MSASSRKEGGGDHFGGKGNAKGTFQAREGKEENGKGRREGVIQGRGASLPSSYPREKEKKKKENLASESGGKRGRKKQNQGEANPFN